MLQLKRITKMRELMILVVVIIAFVLMTFASPFFLSQENLLAVLLGLSLQAIMAVGMTNLMVSGGFDMSVGSTLGLTGGVAALLYKAGLPVLLCVVGGILAGGLVGLFNGFTIAKIGVTPFVTTLATNYMCRGLLLVVTGGKNISNLGEDITWIGQFQIADIQLPIIYAVIIIIAGDILLRKSRYFRQSYYIGGNEKAAQLSGIQVRRVKIINYVTMGLLAGFCGVVTLARLGSASTTAGTGEELRVITAVIIGGASMSGGEGTVLGSFLGCFLMAIIANAMTLLGVVVYWQTFVTGFTLLAAVLIDSVGKLSQAKPGARTGDNTKRAEKA